MSELEDAVARLNAAVARLEAATDPERRVVADDRAADAAAAIAARIDAALAKLAQLLERED